MVLVFKALPVVTKLIQAVGVDIRKSVFNKVSVYAVFQRCSSLPQVIYSSGLDIHASRTAGNLPAFLHTL